MAMLIPAYTMRFGQSFGWGGMMIFNPGDLPQTFKEMCGPGTDGVAIRSENGNETSLFTESYTVNAGVTMTATEHGVLIFAKKRITIAGTLKADALGAAGGAGGVYEGSTNAEDGTSGVIGGSGGKGATNMFTPGEGGVPTDLIEYFNHYLYLKIWDMLNGSLLAGSHRYLL